MAGRDRDRARGGSSRTNEYFVPKDGIDREVITADICRYLGNDALVRPGVYKDPRTGVNQQGYFINAYRNLTTAMIADLKADSERWDAERRQTASIGQQSNVEYRSSTTHQSRQYYGPTEAAPPTTQTYAATQAYASVAPVAPDGVYGGYQQQQQYGAQPAVYAPEPGYPIQNDYYAGADFEVNRTNRGPAQTGTVPRTNQAQYQTTYQTQADNRGYASYPAQTAPSPVYAQASTSSDAYGRAAAGTYESASGIYSDGGYPEQGGYGQPQVPTTTASTTQASTRRDREGESERNSRHHRSHR
jgi:hypothetical protein